MSKPKVTTHDARKYQTHSLIREVTDTYGMVSFCRGAVAAVTAFSASFVARECLALPVVLCDVRFWCRRCCCVGEH